MDKSATNAYYDIEVDPKTSLPLRIRLTVLTGKRGTTVVKKGKIIGGDHVAFHFEYSLSDYGKVERPKIPAAAKKLLASR